VAKKKIPRKNIYHIFQQYISGKKQKDLVRKKIFKVGTLRKTILKKLGFSTSQDIYVSTFARMHIYEKRGEVLQTMILPYFKRSISSPDWVYMNKGGKNRRGQILFVKVINKHYLAVVLEIATIHGKAFFQVVTIFICNHNYFRNLKCLWNGRTATPSS